MLWGYFEISPFNFQNALITALLKIFFLAKKNAFGLRGKYPFFGFSRRHILKDRLTITSIIAFYLYLSSIFLC